MLLYILLILQIDKLVPRDRPIYSRIGTKNKKVHVHLTMHENDVIVLFKLTSFDQWKQRHLYFNTIQCWR